MFIARDTFIELFCSFGADNIKQLLQAINISHLRCEATMRMDLGIAVWPLC